jgi:UDP-N-acetylglucosamine:LPS N-acetylglucosamine transferase
MNTKILILIGDVGSGHRSCANALVDDLSTRGYKDIKIIDILSSDKNYFTGNGDGLHRLVTRFKVIEYIHNLLFRLFCHSHLLYLIFERYLVLFLYPKTKKKIDSFEPHIILSIHPISSIILSRYKKDNPQIFSCTIISDLSTVFRGWADKNADAVFCATSDAEDELINYGVNKKKIMCPFYPIHTKYQKSGQINSDQNNILVLGGGIGIVSMQKVIEEVTEAFSYKYKIIVVAGNSKEFGQYLAEKYKSNDNFQVLGFVNNLEEYMMNADLIISKPGPASILEIEALGKKALFTRKVGFQEIGNVNYLLKNPNFRHLGRNLKYLRRYLEILLTSEYIDNWEAKNKISFASSIIDKIEALQKIK